MSKERDSELSEIESKDKPMPSLQISSIINSKENSSKKKRKYRIVNEEQSVDSSVSQSSPSNKSNHSENSKTKDNSNNNHTHNLPPSVAN